MHKARNAPQYISAESLHLARTPRPIKFLAALLRVRAFALAAADDRVDQPAIGFEYRWNRVGLLAHGGALKKFGSCSPPGSVSLEGDSHPQTHWHISTLYTNGHSTQRDQLRDQLKIFMGLVVCARRRPSEQPTC